MRAPQKKVKRKALPETPRQRRARRNAPPADAGVQASMLPLLKTSFVPGQMGTSFQQVHEPAEVKSTPAEGDVHASDAERRRRGSSFGTTRRTSRR